MGVVGKGRSALETFSGFMGMLPPISQPAYSSHNKKLLVVSQKERAASCSAAVAELRKDIHEDDIVDITVTFFLRQHLSMDSLSMAVYKQLATGI